MMQLNRKIKILGMFVTAVYGALVLAETQPQPNGASLGSTTGTSVGSVSAATTTTNTAPATGVGTTETAPSDITTMDPMDPSRDSRTNGDATMRNDRSRRAMGTASGTTAPESTTDPSF